MIRFTAHTRRVFALACLAIVVSAGGAAPAMAQTTTKPVVIASSEDIISLDPHMLDINHPTGSVIWSIFDSLVRRAPDGSAQPRLATSWEKIDPLTWRFHLRTGVTFSNGETFDAQAVKYNLDRMARPPFSTVQQLHQQTSLKEVKVVDAQTMDLITEKPTLDMLYWLEEAFIGAPKYLAQSTPEQLARQPVGSGPYKLVQWRRGDQVQLEANPTYWGTAPAVKQVVFRNIPEVSSRLNELRAGSVDIATGITPDSASQADSELSTSVSLEGLRKMHMGISLNGEQPALKDPRVRQALNYAVDVKTIIDSMMGGATSQLRSTVNPPNNNPALAAWTFDPAKARELLAQAGYPEGFPLTLQWSTRYSGGKEVAEVVGSYLEQVGIKPTYEAVELGQFLHGLSTASLKGIYFQGWAALINPQIELIILTCGHVDNSSGYCNPKYDELVHKAANTPDDAERQKLQFAAQQIVWNDAPWLYLWRLPTFYGISKKLSYTFRGDNYVEPYLITYK
jgi:peptide/nickel transport system substrate-binding protein